MWSTGAVHRSLGTLIVIVLLAACSGGDAGNTTTTTTEASTTPAPSVTSTTASETTTTTQAAVTTTTTIPTTTTTPDPLAPEGSGCTPGTEVLPDGEWYGGVRAFDAQTISFDLACLFIGDAATAAAAEDGEESPPPNDYYVRNENEQVRVLTVDADTPVTWYTSGDPNDEEMGTYPEWIEWLANQESYLGIWVTVESGAVTEIAERWVP